MNTTLGKSQKMLAYLQSLQFLSKKCWHTCNPCNPCNFYPKNVGILKIHMNATPGKSHLGANLATFIPKNVGILKIHIDATLGKSNLGSNIAIFIQKTLAF